ncbi:hypothetical protein ACIGZJ_26710 [Kitasatospora sp. NPDC052868]|uniref:hypothetical protein n=1 Tax=Kitasatospora sp. NPDC052868 TaxID=3364060 RepID=UPI0037C6BF50
MAAHLAIQAFIEIRSLAGRAQRPPEEVSSAETLDRIRLLADLGHNLPVGDAPRARRPTRGKPDSRRERAMRERPMSWLWNTASPEKRTWVLSHVVEIGLQWTPPPPLPTPRKGVPPLSTRQRIGLLAGWPVKTPSGRQPLPREARVLKALDSDAIFALHEEAGRLRLGLGGSSPWLQAHLDPSGPHYLLPDPAEYYWPNPEAGRPWWQCRVLLTMIDGEQVSSMLAVLPETFAALPSTVPRFRQHRLANVARATERDTGLWGRDHKPHCGPKQCGYIRADGETTST